MKYHLTKKDINRLCVFSFYDPDGHVDKYIIWILEALDSLISDWIIVVNGTLERCGEKELRRFTKHIFKRENRGFDAGGYQYILCHCLRAEELSKYDEIVLCNNTFFFLRNSFDDLFQQAYVNKWDFWGITGYLHVIFSHIQSYFLVFSRKIIEQNLLIDYLGGNVDGRTNDIGIVCAQFEMGLFDFLVEQHHMRYGCLIDLHDLDVYGDSFRCLQQYNIPIVKKKTFSSDYDLYNMLITLKFLRQNTNFPVELIEECIARLYKVPKDEEKTVDNSFDEIPLKIGMSRSSSSESMIEKFLMTGNYYIYGAGVYACKAYWKYARRISGFKGFVVSDCSNDKPVTLFGYPVFFLQQIKPLCQKKILVAVKTVFADEIMEQFSSNEKENVLRIF